LSEALVIDGVTADCALLARVQDRRHQLRQAAARLFSRHGLRGFSLKAAGLESGLGRHIAGTLFHDGDDLLADLLVTHLIALDGAICAAFDAGANQPPAERLFLTMLAFLTIALGQRDAHRALRHGTRLLSEDSRASVQGRSRQVIATIRQAMLACEPALDAAEPALAGLLVRQLAGSASEAAEWFTEDDRVDRHGLARLLVSQALVVARAAVDGTWTLPFVPALRAGGDEVGPEQEAARGDPAGTAQAHSSAATSGGAPATPVAPDPSTISQAAGAPQPVVAAATTSASDAASRSGVVPQAATGAGGARPGWADMSDGGTQAADGRGMSLAGRATGPAPAVPDGSVWLAPEQARRSLAKLVRAAAGGTEIALTHHGWPAAKLVPADQERAALQRALGRSL
jgi:prevent-host-death family protein